MSSKSEIALSARGISKSYAIAHEAEHPATLVESLLAKARRPFARALKETFWALKDVDFDIKKGDVVGIIGRNGAGKSTLLKILSRITEPSAGQIDLYGRVGSLLEVGTGFHPELTGRENVFLNGAILGMSKAEIRRQFDAIVDFAGVQQFLDTPVKRYSSGMYVRLAFAVAAHLSSEILIVDEVLAVGDAEFQKKCLGKMQELAVNETRTVLFVSHNVAAVAALCNRCLFLEAGRLRMDSVTPAAISAYVHSGVTQSGSYEREADPRRPVQIVACATLDDGRVVVAHSSGRPITVFFRITCQTERSGLELTVQLANAAMQPICSTNLSNWTGRTADLTPGTHEFELTIPANFLVPGEYSVTVGLHQPGVEVVEVVENAARFRIEEVGSKMARYHGQNYGSVLVNFEWREQLATGTSS